MKPSILLPAIVFVLISCSGPKQTASSSPASATTSGATGDSNKSVNDGSSYEKAIVINKTSEMAGIAAEYEWLSKNYPGYKTEGQSLQHKDKKSYDVIHIVTKDGEKKDIYFDITKFFGKF